ncbi:hypothetical protein JM93_02457 [Roseibium hamelinense]|uniref:Serine/threonine protein kinase n=1 Tax=Roseibium hamelinense TaxID=150831 RepID=A0A562T0V5_9HYPH|nr:serine/threonine protein kinase [Roseibium hamelinense]MTI44591.1 serine/threonine protein kinase [Roseibium hamelinense]TWI87217.1 hypothetical protein JM93_02457 [Roseibium hamelinense]
MRGYVFALFAVVVWSAMPAEARVYCPLPEDGVWVNPDAEAKEITRIEVETTCIDDTVQARIRAFTSCIPRDCKWGWTKAEMREGGGFRVELIGFLGAKVISVRSFGDILDTHVIDIAHDPEIPMRETTFNLRRK